MNSFTELGEKYGQYEEFTGRIRNLLKDYPDGLSIPKELIQNSDDAKATEAAMLLDLRQHPVDNLLNNNLEPFYGPSIVFWNNQQFTENDFANLCKFGGETKLEDRTKVGKFGLGFNSVYNITDLPSFVSGQHLCMLDPHECYLGKRGRKWNLSAPAKDESSGRLGDILEAHLRPFDDLFGFHRSEVADGIFYHGTIFRFPLRTLENAAKSEIRNKPYTDREAYDLFDMTRKYGKLLILFTQFVEKFTMYVFEEGADSMQVFENCCYKRNVLPFPAEGKFCTSYPQVLQGSSDQFNRIYKVTIECPGSVYSYVVSVCAPGERSSDKTRCVGAVALNIEGPGITDENHLLFCFLPIPQPANTELPFMVNGTFAITSSRRQIEIQTMDDKADDSRFNKIILEKAIPKALIDALTALAKTSTESETLRYFPMTSKTEANIYLVVKEFYKLFVSSQDLKIFETSRGKVALAESRVKIVSSELPYNVKKEIVNFFCQNNATQSQIIIDIPSFLLEVLEKHQSEFVRSKIVTLSTLLPTIIAGLREHNVASVCIVFNYVLGNSEYFERNTYVLKSKPWILSQDPSGILKRPCDLINPEGNAFCISADLKESLISPVMNFSTETIRILLSLGMPTNELPAGMFTKLFQKLQTKTDSDLVKAEFLRIVNFLEETPSFNNREWASVFEIPHIANKSTLKWLKPKECYEKSLYEYTVGLTHPTVCFGSLGIKHKGIVDQKLELWRAPDSKIVIANAIETCDVADLDERIGRLKNIFKFLDKKILHQNEISKLPERPIIPTSTSGVFKRPKDVAVNDCPSLEGHLYTIHEQMKDSTVRKFIVDKLGAPCKFSAQEYSEALCKMKSMIISHEIASQVIEILKYLKHLGPKHCTGPICIPSSVRKMDFPDKMCFGEETDCLPGFEAQFCHQDIPPALAKAFNVRTLRQLELDHVSNNVILKPFGQYEKLTNRLSRIVENYSSDLDIFKEMLQNADDAGATECNFILDQRSLTTENLIDDGWQNLQGPSLVVFNNAPFTEQDIIGLQCLGEGSKSDNVLKIGQYGVGFNCVYKFTDTPCFVTQLEGKGPGIFCLLDPDYQIVKRTGISSTPGAYLDLSPDFIKRRNGTFDGFMLKKYDVLNAKTLFRLPLRKKESSISTHCPTFEDMNNIFETFCECLKQIVLFLNIKKVRVLTIAEDGTEFILRQVSRQVAEKNLSDLEGWKEKVKTPSCSSPMSFYYNVVLNDESFDGKRTQQKWTIMEHVGSGEPIPKGVRDALSSGKMGNIKLYAAVAFLHRLGRESKEESPNLYCYLPLPDSSLTELIHLPVAINGPFSLDESRRSIQLEDDTSSHKWNLYVLENLVGECYANFVLQAAQNLMKKKAHYKEFMKLLPSSEQKRFPSTGVALHICKGLFKHLAAKKRAFVPVLDVDEKMKDLAHSNEVFYFLKRDNELLYILAVKLNLPITQLDWKYGPFWRSCGCDIKALSANHIINALPRAIATPCVISQSVLKNRDTLLYLLERASKEDPNFFQKVSKTGMLPIYPIFLAQDGVIHRGNEQSSLLSCSGGIQAIFPKLCFAIIDPNVESGLWNAFSFLKMNVNSFLTNMQEYYPHLCAGRDVPLIEESHKWLACVWYFLWTRGKEEIEVSMNDLKFCSILPCRNSRNETVLISIGKRKAILKNRKTITVGLASIDISSIENFYSFYREPLAKHSQELNFLLKFMPDDEERLQDPEFLLEILHRVYLLDNFKQVFWEDRQNILDYFVKNQQKLSKSEKCIYALSQLPIHPNLEDNHASLPEDKRKFCVNAKVPRAGLLDKTESIGYSYFKTHNKEFQEMLGVIHQEDEQLYVEYAIPFAFQSMLAENLFEHLSFLNEYYKKPDKNSSSVEALSALTQALSNASFVRVSPDCVKKPRELYSPRIPVFRNFVHPDSLVPQEYMNKFGILMNYLEVQKVVTEKHFRRFGEDLAQKVIELGSFGENMKNQSISLLEYVVKENATEHNVQLMPWVKDESVLSKETLENFAKLEIFWDVSDRPVSLKKAFNYGNLPLVSHVAKVLHKDISMILPGELNTTRKPQVNLIFSNVEKLAALLKTSLENENNEKTLSNCQKLYISHIKTCINELSLRKDKREEIKSNFESCECVLTSKQRLLSPNLICIALPREAVSGMKNYIDTCHSEFYSVLTELKTLGAQSSITVKQIQVALTKAYQDFLQGEKDPNFAETVKFMVEHFFKLVIEHPEDIKDLIARTPLYLLSCEKTLDSTSNLCYVDKDASPECRKRWSTKCILHISEDSSEIRDHLESFSTPHRVAKMSSLIKTTLDQKTYDESNITQSNLLENCMTALQSAVFYEVLAGYLIYVQVKSGERKKLERELRTEVDKKDYVFCNVIFLTRESAQEGSFPKFIDESQTVWETNDKLIFATNTISSEHDLKDKIVESVLMPFCQKADAKILKTLLFECFTDNQRRNWLFEITGDEVTAPSYYQAGDIVPPELHALLDQKPIQDLEEGILVALLEGNLGDESSSYKFARVIGTLQEPDPDQFPPNFGLYELDMGSERLLGFKGVDIFVFKSSKKSNSTGSCLEETNSEDEINRDLSRVEQLVRSMLYTEDISLRAEDSDVRKCRERLISAFMQKYPEEAPRRFTNLFDDLLKQAPMLDKKEDVEEKTEVSEPSHLEVEMNYDILQIRQVSDYIIKRQEVMQKQYTEYEERKAKSYQQSLPFEVPFDIRPPPSIRFTPPERLNSIPRVTSYVAKKVGDATKAESWLQRAQCHFDAAKNTLKNIPTGTIYRYWATEMYLKGIESCLCSAAHVTGQVDEISSLSDMSSCERIVSLASSLSRSLRTKRGENDSVYSQLAQLCDRIIPLIQFIDAEEECLIVEDDPPTLPFSGHVLANVEDIGRDFLKWLLESIPKLCY